MSAFEFFFSLYGLVLGLSVVAVVSGFTGLAHDRQGVKVGWLTPMPAALMLLNLAWFWVSAYRRFQDHELSYVVLVFTLGAASLYYIAASLVFPRDFAREPGGRSGWSTGPMSAMRRRNCCGSLSRRSPSSAVRGV